MSGTIAETVPGIHFFPGLQNPIGKQVALIMGAMPALSAFTICIAFDIWKCC
jgi:hypothetical protein